MKNRVLVLATIAAMFSASLTATTYKVKVNAQSTGNQTFYYVHSAKCGIGNAVPGTIIVVPDGTSPAPPGRRRSARH